jgi:hypothetical protein
VTWPVAATKAANCVKDGVAVDPKSSPDDMGRGASPSVVGAYAEAAAEYAPCRYGGVDGFGISWLRRLGFA